MSTTVKESVVVGGYTITVIGKDDDVLGVIVEGARLPRPIYIAKGERVRVNLPKSVKRYLKRMGFSVE